VRRKAASLAYAFLVAVTAVTVGWAWHAGLSGQSSALSGPGGRVLRDVDVERLLRQIQEGRMSDHEALYFRRIGN